MTLLPVPRKLADLVLVATASLLSIALLACQPPPPTAAPQVQPQVSRPSHSDLVRSGHEGNRSLPSAPGDNSFDFYLLNLSWSPEFCATHAGMPECAQHLAFVLHGLWPQTSSGGYPQHCSNAPGPADPSAFRDIYPDPGLLRHEWQTHGTCSGLAPDAFFSLARSAFHAIAIPTQLTSLNQPVSMTPTAILDLFAAANPNLPRSSLVLSCGNNYLTAVEVCLAKDLSPIACQQVRSCRANIVRIPPPNLASP